MNELQEFLYGLIEVEKVNLNSLDKTIKWCEEIGEDKYRLQYLQGQYDELYHIYQVLLEEYKLLFGDKNECTNN